MSWWPVELQGRGRPGNIETPMTTPFAPLLNRCFRGRAIQGPTPHDHQLVREIRQAGPGLESLSDPQLQSRTGQLRESVATGESPTSDDLLVPAFALVNEALRRALGVSYYDVQFLGGLALTRGAVAEMQTGEGKTFVAALPAFVHALAGRGVYVLTSNGYLADRDFHMLAPAYECLGISAGLLEPNGPVAQKRTAYACDVTYGPGYEFGFDYLRDQVELRRGEEATLGGTLLGRLRGGGVFTEGSIQRGLVCAIIDEVDHVLIDDAGSPLIISEATADAAEDAEAHRAAHSMIARLEQGRDYHFDAAGGVICLTEQGSNAIHSDATPIPWKVLLRPWSQYVEQALRVELLFHRDVNYVVQEGEVRVVDESTGRVFAERSWRDGLHQAIEAREGLKITAEKRSTARITRQRLFRLYDRLCGMTGTAMESEGEFQEFFNLGVAPIPTWKPCQRKLGATRSFANTDAKWDAVVGHVQEIHRTGRPVLVGTRTIAASEVLSERLDDHGVPHQVLNGKQDADEASIVARAGEAGAVTIATNMAGRGTDIKLGPGVADRGGLHVIGTERHTSRRIDRQLIGRCARQGDPGTAQFFVSADDELIRIHRPWLVRAMKREAGPDGEARTDYKHALDKTQTLAEKAARVRRRNLFHSDRQRDDVMAKFAGEDHD